MDTAPLRSLAAALSGKTVAVVGDLVADEFVYGRVARVSREAPVLILEYDTTEIVAGGAGNAANNVAALGGRPALVALAGTDDVGRRLVASLHPRVDRSGIQRLRARTPVKTRILAGGIHSAKQQVVRIDRASTYAVTRAVRTAFERAALDRCEAADAVLISDYGSGLVTPAFAARIRTQLRRSGHPVPVLVDTRYQLLAYHGLTACTPNESEVEAALGIEIDDDPVTLERAGRAILERTGMDAVLITRGSRGMALFVTGARTVHIPIVGSDEVADVTGAGDTVMATMTLALAAGGSFAAAARLANYAGGLVVMKRGTATVSADELQQALGASTAGPAARLRPAGR